MEREAQEWLLPQVHKGLLAAVEVASFPLHKQHFRLLLQVREPLACHTGVAAAVHLIMEPMLLHEQVAEALWELVSS